MNNNNDTNNNRITPEHINAIMNACEVCYTTVFGKATVVSAKLPNGFVITESSACVDPANYDEKIGRKLAMDKIIDKVWELEGYRLQCGGSKHNETDIVIREAKRHGDTVHIDLWYPRELNNASKIQIGLTDVRAAKDIRVSYDFDKDGWLVEYHTPSSEGFAEKITILSREGEK